MKQSIYISSTFLYYWELYKEKLSSIKSQYTYWSDLNSFVEFCKKDFLEIQLIDVDEYYTKSMYSMKLSTLQKKIREFSAFSDFIIETGEQDFENYFIEKLIDLNYKVKMSKQHIPSVEDMNKLLEVSKENILYYSIFALIFKCALKPKEIINIKPSDFFIKDITLYLIITGKKERIIEIPDDIKEILNQYNNIRNVNSEYYFGNNKIPERTLEYQMNRYAKKAGVPNITLYGIRNASIGTMTSSGISDKRISEMTGIGVDTIERYKQVIHIPNEITLSRIKILPPDIK